MMSDRELWACAAQVELIHGDRAPLLVAERVGALALAGDASGVSTWREIAHRLDKLIRQGEAR